MANLEELEDAWRTEPGDPQTFSALAGRYIVDGDWRKLVALFEDAEDSMPGSADRGVHLIASLRELAENADVAQERGAILVAIGDASLKYTGDREGAMKAYQDSFKAYKHDTTCLERARGIYRETDDWSRVFLLYKLELGVKDTPETRSEVLIRMAQVQGEFLDQKANALEIIDEASKLTPGDPFLKDLRRIYESGGSLQGQLQEVLADAEEARSAGEGAMAAELLLLGADIERQREGGSLEVALEYVEVAHALEPENAQAEQLLELLMRELGRERELDDVGHAGVVAMAPVDVGGPTNGASAAAQPADTEEEDPPQGVSDGFSDGFDDDAVATQRIDISTLEMYREEDRARTGDDDVSSEAFDDEVGDAAQAADRVSGDISEAYDEPAEDDVEASSGDSLASDEADRDSELDDSMVSDESDRVSEPSVDSDEFDRGSDVDDSMVSDESDRVSEPSVVSDEFDRGSDVDDSMVSDEQEREFDDQATQVFRPFDPENVEGLGHYVQVLSNEPSNLQALEGLYHAAQADGDWDTFVDQSERSLKRLRKKRGELEVMARLATVLWQELADMQRAEYYFKRIKLLDSEYPAMLEFYESYFEEAGEWRKLFAMLSTAQQHATDPERRRALTGRLAELAEVRMESPEKAIDVWKGYLRDADDPHAREELRRLYEENGKWSALVDYFKEDLHSLPEDASDTDRIELLRKMARIYDDELGLEPMVINTLQDILSLDPSDETAFSRLRELLVHSRRMNDLAQLLSTRADSAVEHGDIATATEYLSEVAEIWMDHLRNVTQALPYLERILEIAPDNSDVRHKLMDIYEKRRDYGSLFEVQRTEAMSFEGDERLSRLRDLVELAVDRIRDPSLAVPVLHEILELAPGDEDSLHKLEFIHRKRDEHEALAGVLVIKAEFAASDDERVEALSEAARIHATRLGNVDYAVQVWNELLSVDPSNHRALASLTEVYISSQAFEQLDELYRERDQLDQLYDLLDSAAATSDDIELRRAVYRTMANLAENDLGAPDRVILSLESLREIAEEPTIIVRELIRWYHEVGDVDQEIAMNRALLDAADRPDDRLDTLERLRELEADREDASNALHWAIEAVRTAPRDHEAQQRAEELARRADGLSRYVSALEDIAADVDDDDLQESLWGRAGSLYWRELQETGAAIVLYERLYERQPTNLDYLSALEQLYDAAGAHEQRINMLRNQVDVLKDRGASDADVVDEYGKIADVQRQMGEYDAARTTYAEILDMDPEHLGALRGLKELYRQEGRWEDVVECLVKEAALVPLDDEARRVRVDLELGDVHRTQIGDLAEALRFYAQVLATVPDQPEAVGAVETLLSEPSLAREAALLLEPVFRESEAHPQLAAALEARRAVVEDRFEEAEILDELIPLYRDVLQDPSAAFDRACRQFELDPDRSEIWLRLEQLGASLNRWHDLEAIFSRFVPEDSNAHPTRFDLLKHLAAIRENVLQSKEGALECWERLYEYDSLDSATVEALERLYRQLGHWESLVTVLESRSELVDDPDARIDMLMEAARISDEVAADTERTVELYKKVLLADPDAEAAVEALRGVLAREDAWSELEELLASQAEYAADPDRRRQLLLELVEVRGMRLGDHEGAAETLTALLNNDPDDEDALASLRRLDMVLEELGNAPEVRQQLASVVEPIFRAKGDFASLAGVLRVRLDAVEDDFDRVSILDELGRIYLEDLADRESAFEVTAQAVALAPDDEARRERLEELAEAVGRFDQVLTTYAHAADEADSYVAGDLFRRMGEIYEQRMGLAAEAIACYEHALTANESDEELLESLSRLYEAVQSYEKLADNLRRQATFGDPDRRPEFLLRVGLIEQDILERNAEAIDAFSELLEASPDDAQAIEALQTLYQVEERWADLADLLGRKAASSQDVEVQLAALEQLALIQEDALEDRQSAIDVYRQMLAIDPVQPMALGELERLYESEESWADLAEVLRARLNSTDDPDAAIRVELKLAEVLAVHLFSGDEALGLLRGVLERDEDNAEALAALERLADDETFLEQVAEDLIPLYTLSARWADLVELYERLQLKVLDPEVRSDYFHRISQIQRDGLGDLAAATEALAQAWKLNVDREELHDELLAIVSASQEWTSLADIYADVLIEVSDPEKMLELRMRLARLYHEQLEDDTEAEVHYREALTLDESNDEAHRALEQILMNGARWEDLVEILEHRFGALATSDPDQARATLHQIGRVQDELMEDQFTAVNTYNRILEIEPRDPDALEAVERLLQAQERWEDLNAHLINRLDLTSDPETTIRLKSQLATLTMEHLHDPLGALDLYREILESEPDHPATISALQEIFESNEEFQLDASRLLEPVLRRHELWDGLVVVLLARAEHPDERMEAPGLYREIGEISEQRLGDGDRARDAYTKLFAMEPGDDAVRAALERNAVRTQQWGALAATYVSTLDENYEVSDDLRCVLLAELAGIYEERLEDLDQARDAYEQIIGFQPDSARALDALDRIYSRQSDWQALADLYRSRSEVTLDPDERADWLYNLANLYEEILDDVESAIDVYNELVQVDPDASGPRRVLERLLRQCSRWHELADLYREESELSSDPAAALDHKFKLGELLEAELEQLEDALLTYEEIIAADPHHYETRSALDGLLRDLKLEDGDIEMRRRIVELLLEHADPERDLDRMLDLIEDKIELTEDVPGKVTLYRQMADLLEGATSSEDRVRGMVALAHAHRVDPANEDLRRKISTIAMETETWDKLVPLYLGGLEQTDDIDVQVGLLLAVADIYAGPMQAQDSAITAYQQIIDIQQDNEKALAELEKLYSELELWDPLVEVLAKRVDAVYEVDVQERVLRRMARIQEEILADPPAAVLTMERLREIDPVNMEYVNALSRLYEDAEQFEDLEELLRVKVGLLDNDGARLKALKHMAKIQAKLDRPDDAIDSYRNVLSIDENDVGAVRSLTDLYERVERWPELLETLHLLRDFADGVSDLNEVELRLGIVLARHLNAGEEAIEKFEQVLARDPGSQPAREAMLQLLADPTVGDRVAEILEGLYRQSEEYRELEAMFEAILSAADDLPRRRAAYQQLAGVQVGELDNPSMAFVTYGRAVQEFPGDGEFRSQLEGLARSLDQMDELVAVYEDCVEQLDDPDVSLTLHNRLGQIYAQMDDLDAAVGHYRKSLEIDEFDVPALVSLDRLFQVQQDWNRLAEILEREVNVLDGEAVVDARYRLGYLREVVFEDPEVALDLYSQVVVDAPDHGETIDALDRLIESVDLRMRVAEILEPLLVELQQHERLVRLYTLKLELTEDPLDQATLLESIANIHLDFFENLEIGYAFLSRSLRADPANAEVQIRLEALVDSTSMHEELVALYEEICEDLEDPIRVVELALVGGTISYTHLGDIERAWQTFERVLAIENENEAALASMEEIARGSGDVESLAAVLEREAAVVFDPENRRRILVDLSRARTQLEQYEEAAEALRQALTIDEGDVEVLSMMVELLEITESYQELVETLQRLVMFEHEPTAQFQTHVRIARVSRVLLEDVEAAIEAYRAALGIDPNNIEVLVALEELFEQTEQWDRVRQVVNRHAQVAEPDDAVALWGKMASISYSKFNEAERAIEEYSQALKIDPTHRATVSKLDALYRKEERWRELLGMYERVLSATPSADIDRTVGLQVEMADISAKHLGDESGAITYLESILEVDPNHLRALDVLADLYGSRGDWDAGLKMMERRMKACRTADEQVQALLHRAHIFEDQLDRPSDAANDYVRVIELSPLHDEALERLKALYERLQAHREMYNILEYEASHRESPDAKAEIYVRMAGLARDVLGDSGLTVAALESAYAIRGNDLEVVGPLLDAYLAAGQTQRAEPLLEAVIEQLRADRKMKEVVRFLHLQGRLNEQKGDLDAAYESYDAAHKVDASYIPNLISLGKLLYGKQDWEQALKIFQTLLLHQMNIESDQDKVDIYYHLGMVRWHQGDTRRAKDMFNRALNIDGSHELSKQAMSQL